MEPDPIKIIINVVIIGLLIGGVSVAALLFVFRALEDPDAPKMKPVAILGGLLGFIFLCAAAFFILSYR